MFGPKNDHSVGLSRKTQILFSPKMVKIAANRDPKIHNIDPIYYVCNLVFSDKKKVFVSA
jgi:hypothetical protein